MKSSRLGLSVVGTAAACVMASVSAITIARAQDTLSIGQNESIFVDGKSLKVVRGKAKDNTGEQIKKLSMQEIGPGVLIVRSGDKLYLVAGPAEQQPAPGLPDPNRPHTYLNDPNRPYAYNPGRDVANYVNDPNRPYAYNPGRDVANYVNDPNRPYAYNPGRDVANYVNDPNRPYAYNPGRDVANYVNDPNRPYAYNPGRDVANYVNDPNRRSDVPNPGQAYINVYILDSTHAPPTIHNPSASVPQYIYDPGRVSQYMNDPNRPYTYDPGRGVAYVNDPEAQYQRLKKAFADNWTTSEQK